jgi:hypothetical protein
LFRLLIKLKPFYVFDISLIHDVLIIQKYKKRDKRKRLSL